MTIRQCYYVILIFCWSGSVSYAQFVPYCTKVTTFYSKTMYQDIESLTQDKIFNASTVVNAKLNLGETMCLKLSVENSSGRNLSGNKFPRNLTVLYTLKFAQLTQNYPIKQKYTFSIPEIESNCICDCPGGEILCPMSQNLGNCSKNVEFCTKTYHHHQKATGCFSGREAEVCCEVKIRPYNGIKYEAITIANPLVVGRFEYKVFVADENIWRLRKTENFKVWIYLLSRTYLFI